MPSQKKLLEEIGLSSVAADIYLYLLDVKKATPLAIARGTELRRTTVYAHLNDLLEINLIGEVIEKGKKYFIPESPEYLKDFIKEKRLKAEKIAKELEKQFGGEKNKAHIRYAHGTEGFKKFAEKIISAKENRVRIYLHYQSLQEYVSANYIENFLERYARTKRELQVIVSGNERSLLMKETSVGGNAKANMRIKSLPKGRNFTTSIVVYDDKAHFFAPKSEGYIFIFESNAFSDTIRKMFDYMWGMSENIN